jgi:hypothetical protein
MKQFDSFIYTSIETQLREIIEFYYDQIITYMNSTRNFMDIIDGSYYINNKKNQSTLHLMLYTDGVQLNNSNNKHFWPVYLELIELPAIIRNSKRSKIIFGIWIGKKKPTSDILFCKLLEQIKKYKEKGIEVQNKNKNKVKFYIDVYGFMGDTPAKSLVMNMTQFNSYYGCPYCLNPGI